MFISTHLFFCFVSCFVCKFSHITLLSITMAVTSENSRRKQLFVYHLDHSEHDGWLETHLDDVELLLQRRKHVDAAIEDLEYIHHQSDDDH